jgi:hypothetical protein
MIGVSAGNNPERSPITKPITILGRALRSEPAADEERRQIRRRQRSEFLFCRSQVYGPASVDDPPKTRSGDSLLGELQNLRAEVQRLRAELKPTIQAEVRRILVEELPGAVQYLTQEGSRNGIA